MIVTILIRIEDLFGKNLNMQSIEIFAYKTKAYEREKF